MLLINTQLIRKPLLAFVLAWLASCDNNSTGAPNNGSSVAFLDTQIVFPTLEQSRELLSSSDTYSQNLSKFDIQAKSHNSSANSEQDYLDYARHQAQSWTVGEVENLTSSISHAEKKIKSLGIALELPEINVLKSTAFEEGGSPYTRSDYIVLTAKYGTEKDRYATFLHELFHIYSRANPDKRDEIYATLGFVRSNTIKYPALIADRVITNPDAPVIEHYVSVDIGGVAEDVVIFLSSKSDFTTGNFFDYMTKKLMLLESDGLNKVVKTENGKPIFRAFTSPSNLLSKIGVNTDYNIHPEEISAEHFRLLVTRKQVPEPSFLNSMKTILTP